jgi:hypothetical protein
MPSAPRRHEQARHPRREEEENRFPGVRDLMQASELTHRGGQVRPHEQALRNRGAPRLDVQRETGAAGPLT